MVCCHASHHFDGLDIYVTDVTISFKIKYYDCYLYFYLKQLFIHSFIFSFISYDANFVVAFPFRIYHNYDRHHHRHHHRHHTSITLLSPHHFLSFPTQHVTHSALFCVSSFWGLIFIHINCCSLFLAPSFPLKQNVSPLLSLPSPPPPSHAPSPLLFLSHPILSHFISFHPTTLSHPFPSPPFHCWSSAARTSLASNPYGDPTPVPVPPSVSLISIFSL